MTSANTGAMLYQLSYEATHWERGHRLVLKQRHEKTRGGPIECFESFYAKPISIPSENKKTDISVYFFINYGHNLNHSRSWRHGFRAFSLVLTA